MAEVLADSSHPRSRPEGSVVSVDDELWRTSADELGAYIRQLDQHLSWMRKWSAFRSDTETIEAVKAIQQKLAVAMQNHRDLCRLCEERLHDTPDALVCCQKIDDLMHEVIEDHLALMHKLRARRLRRPN